MRINWRYVFFGLIANFLVLVVVLYAFEWLHRVPHFEIKPGEKKEQSSWGVPLHYNKDGFRERELVPKSAGTYRVMVIGDSFTFGVGVPTEERYSNRLEHLLQTRYPAMPIEVLNLSSGGNPTPVERDLLKQYRAVVEPNLIVIGFCLNDLEIGLYNDDWTRFQLRYGPYIDKLTRGLVRMGLRFTGPYLRDCIYKLAQVTGVIPQWDVALDQMYQRDTKEWATFIGALRDIKAMSDEMKLPPPVFLVLNQSAGRRSGDADYAAPSPRLQRILRMYRLAEQGAQEVGFVTINHEREFATELRGTPLRLNDYDAHPSSAMHAVYAKKLFDTVFKDRLPR